MKDDLDFTSAASIGKLLQFVWGWKEKQLVFHEFVFLTGTVSFSYVGQFGSKRLDKGQLISKDIAIRSYC